MTAPTAPQPVLRLSGISKSFPGVRALDARVWSGADGRSDSVMPSDFGGLRAGSPPPPAFITGA